MTPLERAVAAINSTARVQDVSGDQMGVLGAVPLYVVTNPEEVARAVLNAIREPTHAMQAEAFSKKVSFRSGSGMSDIGQVSVEYESEPDKGADTLWKAMIDAMLEEEQV